ncbi:unnamed protein product [Caenorhabditis nigoni]
MPYAYDHLTDDQRSSITEIRFETFKRSVHEQTDTIKLALKLESPLGQIDHKITYDKLGHAMTTMKFGNEDLPPIALNYVYVFLDDLEMLLTHQTSVLSFLDVGCGHGNVEDRAKICERLETILKSKRTLSVGTVRFSGTTVAQAMTKVQYFDKFKLFKVWLIWAVDPSSFQNYLVGLRQVEINNDGRHITFKLAKPTVQSISHGEELPVDSSLSESVAQTVFKNRLTMQFILQHLQCFDIERLRKVNRWIRDRIDLIKPNPNIETYSIVFGRGNGNGGLRIYNRLKNGEFKVVRYFTSGNEVCLTGLKSFPGTDYKSHCLNDMEKTLNYQMECMKELIILYECTTASSEVFENRLDGLGTADLSRKIGDILKSRMTSLKTKKFTMGSNSQMEVMEILPFIEANSLKIIELLLPSYQNYIEYDGVMELSFQVDQISETVQWNNAEHFISKYLTITTPIQEMNIFHFANLEILLKALSTEDVGYLRTKLLNSPNFQKFKIWFRESTINESLHTLIGEPYRIVSDVKKVWYFRIQNTNDYIHIVLDTRDVQDRREKLKPKSINFTRVAKEDTPFF